MGRSVRVSSLETTDIACSASDPTSRGEQRSAKNRSGSMSVVSSESGWSFDESNGSNRPIFPWIRVVRGKARASDAACFVSMSRVRRCARSADELTDFPPRRAPSAGRRGCGASSHSSPTPRTVRSWRVASSRTLSTGRSVSITSSRIVWPVIGSGATVSSSCRASRSRRGWRATGMHDVQQREVGTGAPRQTRREPQRELVVHVPLYGSRMRCGGCRHLPVDEDRQVGRAAAHDAIERAAEHRAREHRLVPAHDDEARAFAPRHVTDRFRRRAAGHRHRPHVVAALLRVREQRRQRAVAAAPSAGRWRRARRVRPGARRAVHRRAARPTRPAPAPRRAGAARKPTARPESASRRPAPRLSGVTGAGCKRPLRVDAAPAPARSSWS